jgi:hypothetical protein
LVSVTYCRYTSFFELPGPIENINNLLLWIVKWSRAGGEEKRPYLADPEAAAQLLIRMFREGSFGPLTLDDCSPETIADWFRADGNSIEEKYEEVEGLRGTIIRHKKSAD